MRRETIMENIRRIGAFYRFPEAWMQERDYIRPDKQEVDLLFTGCGKLLDIGGAPRDGLSFVFVPEDEYNECLTWALNTGKAFTYQNDGKPVIKLTGISTAVKSFGFMDYVGYHWHVNVKEDK